MVENNTEDIKKILEISHSKWKDNWNKVDNDPKRFFDMILGEMNEVSDELKMHNAVKLTDELGDVLWTYIAFLYHLKSLGYIKSMEDVFHHAALKYSFRSSFIEKVENESPEVMQKEWNKAKKIQKDEMKVKDEEYQNSIKNRYEK